MVVWSLVRKGQSVASIAEKLKTTRQFVNQTKLAAEAKLSSALLDVAQANHIHIVKMYPDAGVLLGFHPGLKRRAIITYSTKRGIKVWYWFDKPEEVTDEEFLSQTRAYLLEFVDERGIVIENARELHPAKLAHLVFSELIPEFKQ
jgi:hypothetical protein